jgi:hypothetical protein
MQPPAFDKVHVHFTANSTDFDYDLELTDSMFTSDAMITQGDVIFKAALFEPPTYRTARGTANLDVATFTVQGDGTASGTLFMANGRLLTVAANSEGQVILTDSLTNSANGPKCGNALHAGDGRKRKDYDSQAHTHEQQLRAGHTPIELVGRWTLGLVPPMEAVILATPT